MNLTASESALVFSIMRDLSDELDDFEVRERIGYKLLELLQADYFASYVWDAREGKFDSCVQINMSADNLNRYENHYQFRDPITPTLQRRRNATPVSEIMRHERLVRTEFFNDFLKRDGLHYGLNYFAYDRSDNIGDLRIWRSSRRNDFSRRDAQIVDAIGPSLVNALVRARCGRQHRPERRFAQIGDRIGLTRRESEVADLVALGLSDQEVRSKLGISMPTLRSHVAAIFRKTGINRRAKLTRYLIDQNHLF